MAAQQSTFWQKTKIGGIIGLDKLYTWADKLGPSVNEQGNNKLGSEAFWPTTLDKECDKAARILRSFCRDGFYVDHDHHHHPSSDTQHAPQRILMRIPTEVIRDAMGLVIFTTLRSGLWVSGSGGSGVLVARTADGTWSSPSSIQVQTLALGFLVGVDIYDCVLVINSQKVLDSFTRSRTTLGGDLGVSAGPFGANGSPASESHQPRDPLYSYMKSKGFNTGIQIDGSLIIERDDENERFYREKITAQDILKGKIRHQPLDCRGLYETLKASEGSAHDVTLLPQGPPPSDYEIVQEGHVFSVPDKDDPDPYGVLQLEKEGMVIREAGTQERASWEQFTFSPSITSPVFDTFERRSNRDSRSPATSRRGSWKTNVHSQASTVVNNVVAETSSSKDSLKTPVSMSDMGTQTDDLPPPPSPGNLSFRNSSANSQRPSMDFIPEHGVAASSPSIQSNSDSWTGRKRSMQSSRSPPTTPVTRASFPGTGANTVTGAGVANASDTDAEDTDDDLDDEEPVVLETPIVHSVPTVIAPTVLQKARMVTVPKRGPPPALPLRNPNRHSDPYAASGEHADSRASSTIASSPPQAASSRASSQDSFDPVQSSVNAYLHDSAGGIPSIGVSPADTPAKTPDETLDAASFARADPLSGKYAQQSSINSSRQSLDIPGAFQ